MCIRDSSGLRLRGNAGVASGTGQEIEAGTRVLHPHSPLNWGGCRAGLRRHQPCEGTLLDSCYQRIVSSLPARRDPGRRFGQEGNAGPTEFSLGMGRRGGHHSGDVRRGRSHVCCVDRRISLPWSRARRTPASSVLTFRGAQRQGKTHAWTPSLVCGRLPVNDLHSPGVPRGDADCRHCQLTLACIVTGLTKPADRLSIRTDFGLMGISETLQ